MEGDRIACLMVRAHAQGLIDYRQADPLDLKWYLRHNWLLAELHRTEQRSLHAIELNYWLQIALLRGDLLTPESREELWDRVHGLRTNVIQCYQPWMKIDPNDYKAEHKKLSDEWVERYGDPNSPETAAKIDAVLEWFAENKAKAGQGRR